MDVKKIIKVRDVMIDEFETVHPEADIREAAEKMRQANLGALPVKSKGNLIGMITDRDITVRATAIGKDPEQTTVKETMTPEINFLYEDQKLEEATKLMNEKNIRRLAVKNRKGELIGMISLIPW